jgi:aspartate/glutamate racemase
MKDMIGLLGGYGSRATALIFDRAINVHSRARSDSEFPHLLVYNLPSEVASVQMLDRKALFEEVYLALQALERAGCDRVYMACNSLYTLHDDLLERLDQFGMTFLPYFPMRVINDNAVFFNGGFPIVLGSRATCNKLYPGIQPSNAEQDMIDDLINRVIKRPPGEYERTTLAYLCAHRKVVLACTELSVIYWSMSEQMREDECPNVLDFADELAHQLGSS